MDLRLASPFHLHGVGPAYTMRLAICGVETIGDVLEWGDLKQLSAISTIPLGVLRRIRLKAISLVNDEIIQIAPFIPPSRNKVYLDIETTLQSRIVWLIGFMIDGELTQLYADSYDEERQILSEFRILLRKYRDHALVTWSSFDTRVLCRRMRLHGLHPDPVSSMAHIDLRLEVRRSFIFPTHGYGLKIIGSHLGYNFKNPGLDGYRVALRYEEHLYSGEPLGSDIFEYNGDDVMALPHIMDWTRSWVSK